MRKIDSFMGAFLVATILALFLRLFVVENFRIASSSMAPGLLTGDLVLVAKSVFNLRVPFTQYEVASFKKPVRSDVVAFTLPEHGGETFVKRVVAVGGDRLEIRAGRILVNGQPYTYEKFGDTAGSSLWYEVTLDGKKYVIDSKAGDTKDYGPVEIPPDRFFAIGDNRDDSVDSRDWGPIPYSCLKGRVALVWLSLGERGVVRSQRLGLAVN